MLNPFPQLLVLGFFAPTLLRLAVALTLFVLAVHTYRHASKLKSLHLPIIGVQHWVPGLVATVEILLAAMFFFGWHTQIAALLGLLMVIKYFVYRFVWAHLCEAYFLYSMSTMLLFAVMCVCLLFTSAGALGFDLPL